MYVLAMSLKHSIPIDVHICAVVGDIYPSFTLSIISTMV